MEPIRFVFGVHLHQPVGNFDHVFEQHLRDVYRPLLAAFERRNFFPVVLHLSGPLLEWLERHDRAYLETLGRLVADSRVELLLAGFYEPVLASLPRRDRVEQIRWMREALRDRFGVAPTGLWLTERVWEPELAADLAEAGVRCALVDDRHFLVTGFQPEQLHAPLWTESDGRAVALFPIDERLRYLIPFRPPEETAAYLRELRAAGHRLAVLADDGEKFGGWPGTKEWVYEQGWFERFFDAIGALIAGGEVVLSTLANALETVPSSGLAYLPTASYREMEGWSLPPDAATRLRDLERDLGEARMAGPDGALVRGAHWRNFLVKYPESNRMHKKMQALSAMAREAGDPVAARRAIGRAQCNDAYWHGVFGGLYLPHLREAVWANLALAEGELRSGQALAADERDFDGDGHTEIWVHSDRFSAVLSPARGGGIEEFTRFGDRINYADVLTRRRETYHDAAVEHAAASHDSGDGAASIHDIEAGIRLDALPPIDLEDRALLRERLLPGDLTLEEYAAGGYRALHSWGRARFVGPVSRAGRTLTVALRSADAGAPALSKRVTFSRHGAFRVEYEWQPREGAADAWFAVELSLFRTLPVRGEPKGEVWRHPVETVARSERGLDRTLQGESVTIRWPVNAGRAVLEIGPPA